MTISKEIGRENLQEIFKLLKKPSRQEALLEKHQWGREKWKKN